MNLRQKFEKRIREKENEIKEIEGSIREARAYIQALQDSIKLLPKDDAKTGIEETLLRPGSAVYKAMQQIKETGKPMHVSEIVKGIGLTDNKKNRISLGGSLSRYARNKQIFIRTAPNTFSLLSLAEVSDEPPLNFGVDEESIEEKEIKTKTTGQ